MRKVFSYKNHEQIVEKNTSFVFFVFSAHNFFHLKNSFQKQALETTMGKVTMEDSASSNAPSDVRMSWYVPEQEP